MSHPFDSTTSGADSEVRVPDEADSESEVSESDKSGTAASSRVTDTSALTPLHDCPQSLPSSSIQVPTGDGASLDSPCLLRALDQDTQTSILALLDAQCIIAAASEVACSHSASWSNRRSSAVVCTNPDCGRWTAYHSIIAASAPNHVDWRDLPDPCTIPGSSNPRNIPSQLFVSAAELVSLHSIPNLRSLDASLFAGGRDSYGRNKIRPPKWNWLLERSQTLQNLEILRIGNPNSRECQFDARSVELIASLPRLHSLALEYGLVASPEGLLAPLHRSTSLRALHFATEFLDASRCHLWDAQKCFPQLTSLSLCCFDMMGDAFEQFFMDDRIAHSLQYLHLHLYNRDQSSDTIASDPAVYRRVFPALTRLRVLWLAVEQNQTGGLQRLLPHLVNLPALEELYISTTAGTLTVIQNRNLFEGFWPSVANLQTVAAMPALRRICIAEEDDCSMSANEGPQRRMMLRLMAESRSVEKVECFESVHSNEWNLPKELEQLQGSVRKVQKLAVGHAGGYPIFQM